MVHLVVITNEEELLMWVDHKGIVLSKTPQLHTVRFHLCDIPGRQKFKDAEKFSGFQRCGECLTTEMKPKGFLWMVELFYILTKVEVSWYMCAEKSKNSAPNKAMVL